VCGGLVAGMFRNGIKLFIARNNRNSEKMDDDGTDDLVFINYFCYVITCITDPNYFLLARPGFLGFALYSNIGIQVDQVASLYSGKQVLSQGI
jgi:hypothetical protein